MRAAKALLLLPLGGSCVDRVGNVPAVLSYQYQQVRGDGTASREGVRAASVGCGATSAAALDVVHTTSRVGMTPFLWAIPDWFMHQQSLPHKRGQRSLVLPLDYEG